MDWIAVVDDDKANLLQAGQILSRHDMRVTALRSGRALLDYVRDNKPDLILLDIKMPEMDGFETLERLKAQLPPDEDIPEEARIIAVADAYDAMTSRRSYRDMLDQRVVRREIENGKGTQFDPVFADIMLGMIDDDIDFSLKEN